MVPKRKKANRSSIQPAEAKMKYEVGDLVKFRAFGILGTIWVVVKIEQVPNSTLKFLYLHTAFGESNRSYAYDRDMFKINE